MYVCICNAVTSTEVAQAIAKSDGNLDEVLESLGIGSGCGSCKNIAQEFMHSVLLNDKTNNKRNIVHAA